MNRHLPLITSVIVGLAYVWLGFQIVPLGDDLNFPYYYSLVSDSVWGWLKFAALHFLWSNGRLSDMLQPLWLVFMPDWLRALCMGATAGALCLAVPEAARLKRPIDNLASMFLIALIIFTLRWDAIWMENVAFFCYVFPSVMVIIAMLIWRKPPVKGWMRFLAILFSFAAMTLHEAACAPVMAGLAVYVIINRKGFKQSRRLPMTIAMFFGAILSLCSPPAWERLSPPFIQESVQSIIGGSAFYVVLLIAVILALLIFKREILKRLIHSEWVVWAVSALTSVIFMLAAGYGGRTGWFAQIYALIALGSLLRQHHRSNSDFSGLKPYRGLVWQYLILILVTAHLAILCEAQTRLSRETRAILDQYRRSPDGIVYSDQTADHAMPFYLFGKTHGLPDADDVYYLGEIARSYGRGDTLMTVLPTPARHLHLSTLDRPRRIASISSPGDTLLLLPDSLPTFGYSLSLKYPRRLAFHEGHLYMQTILRPKGREKPLYLYTPVHEDRGEK